MGRFEEEAVPVIVYDLHWLRSNSLHIDAVIGLDLLRKRDSLRVDFREKQIVFDATSPISGRAVPLRQNPWSVTVIIHMEGHRAEMIFDTGMRGTVFYRQALENHCVR